jgi:hypothetical protein
MEGLTFPKLGLKRIPRSGIVGDVLPILFGTLRRSPLWHLRSTGASTAATSLNLLGFYEFHDHEQSPTPCNHLITSPAVHSLFRQSKGQSHRPARLVSQQIFYGVRNWPIVHRRVSKSRLTCPKLSTQARPPQPLGLFFRPLVLVCQKMSAQRPIGLVSYSSGNS